MLSAYSPSREGGGMMQLHSPTHDHHFDTHAVIRDIRRTLSRSPSKTYHFRSNAHNVNTPYAPSPLSPSRRTQSEHVFHFQNMTSPYATRSTQPGRIQRPTLRRTAQTITSMRTRTSPRSPTKRTLFDQSETTPQPQTVVRKRRSTEIDDDIEFSDDDKENISRHNEEQMLSWKTAQTKQEKRRSGGLLTEIQPMSPLKRTDGAMNIDQTDCESPSAKRRSLQAPNSMDFSIFESDIMRDGERKTRDDDWFRSVPMSPSTRFSTIPKRSSSLRKSTLQQRQSDRSSPLRLNNFLELRQNWADGTPNSKKPPRMSLNLPSPSHESPFNAQGHLLSASIHPISSDNSNGVEVQDTRFKHPLSRTVTQSTSSTPGIPDDSPTHEPARRPDRSRSHDFSKSLPIGAMRPNDQFESQSSQLSSQGSFATPANYKTAKPLPAAFMSTGLISKKNRNIDEPLTKAHMPDTPCKKQNLMFPPQGKIKPANAAIRNIQNAFGTPKSPSEVPFGITRTTPFPWAKSTGLFTTRAKQNLVRKASFASLVSIEADDKPSSQSPSVATDSQSTEGYPPTPTKHEPLLAGRCPSVSPSPQHMLPKPEYPISGRVSKFSASKLSTIHASPTSGDEANDSMGDDSPTARLPLGTLLKVALESNPTSPSLRRPRHPCKPMSLSRQPMDPFSYHPASGKHAKYIVSTVSPSFAELDGYLPRTPSEAVFPPDPSSLSISGKYDRPSTSNGHDASPFVPATPTGQREYFANFSNRPSLNLKAPEIVDVDPILTNKFDKVDLVGTGEFSQVYRVSEKPQPTPFNGSFSSSRPCSRSSLPGKVWAVKKSRHPYSGPKDRAKKVHEVDVLKTLGHNEHIVSFTDSWEDKGFLYIQTEFCEEGTLDVFLAQAGLKARLDDFRIWKILLEISLGLRHIHEMGFIHLDLKPANILVTFEGVLKIGDFGMATKWPAKPGIEGEGDREYIGPEILMGRYDKPADVFALGLILLETAGNVQLPDNGLSWQKLRSGDMSDVPSLTWSVETSNLSRDVSGNPLDNDDDEYENDDVPILHTHQHDIVSESEAAKATHMIRRGELLNPPSFMTDHTNPEALDSLVRWMISPNPEDRPCIERVLQAQGVSWVESRRRAGATIFEGNWGPADDMLVEDSEMIDV